MLWPRGGRGPQQKEAGQQQARLAGQAIKPGQGASSPAAPLQPLPGASPPAGSDQATPQETAR